MDVLVDLDVLVERSIVEGPQALARDIGSGDAGPVVRVDLLHVGVVTLHAIDYVLHSPLLSAADAIRRAGRCGSIECAAAGDTNQGEAWVATVEDCRKALESLTSALAAVDAELRARHVPRRTVACRLSDLDVIFVGRLDEHGVHDVEEVVDVEPDVDVRLTMDSDELISLSQGSDDFLHAWLRGRIQISASMRDLLRLRTLFGL